MKKFIQNSILGCLAIVAMSFSSCEKKQGAELSQQDKLLSDCGKDLQMSAGGATVSATNAYHIYLSDINRVGDNYEWIWRAKNPNPGNGSNGTVQDLSHWDIDLGHCITVDDIVEAAYSKDKINWTTFTPTFKEDKSQDCSTRKYVKFDFGTKDGEATYYKLTITKRVPHVDTRALYKSGSNTGCGEFITCGFGCPQTN